MIDQWFSAHIPASFAGTVFLLAVVVTSNSSSEVVSLQPDDTRHPECEEEQQPAASIIKMQCDQSLCVTVSQNWTGRTRGWAVGTFIALDFSGLIKQSGHRVSLFQQHTRQKFSNSARVSSRRGEKETTLKKPQTEIKTLPWTDSFKESSDSLVCKSVRRCFTNNKRNTRSRRI